MFGPALTTLLIRLAAVVGALAVGALAWHYTPFIGAGAQKARLESRLELASKAAAAWEDHARGWQSSFRSAEKLRGQERLTARAAVESQVHQCAARVAEARASARTIERIVTREPTYDSNRCPARELIDPGQLRDALAPPSDRPR